MSMKQICLPDSINISTRVKSSLTLVLWCGGSNIKLKKALKKWCIQNRIFPPFASRKKRQKQTHRGKRKRWKDERHFCRRLRVCNFAGLCRWVMASFFPREKRWRVSSLMCFTSADLISRPGPSHGRQISFSCTDVMSRHWVDTGQCWGMTDDSHPGILIVFLFSCPALSPHSQRSLFFFSLGRLTVSLEKEQNLLS